jgi:hypothetical protein
MKHGVNVEGILYGLPIDPPTALPVCPPGRAQRGWVGSSGLLGG